MAAYYTSCQGSRGEVHRLGGAAGGVRALVKSWSHNLATSMREHDGADYINIELTGRHGEVLARFSGTPEELAKKLGK